MRYTLLIALLGCGSHATHPAPPPNVTPPVSAPKTTASDALLPCAAGAKLPAHVTSSDGHTFTIAAPALTLQILTPRIVRLTYGTRDRASFAVVGETDTSTPVTTGGNATTFLVCTSDLQVSIDLGTARVTAQRTDGTIIADEDAAGGYASGPKITRLIAPGEHFFGFGLRTGAGLDKSGQLLDFWNTDAFVAADAGFDANADLLYETIPFFIGMRSGAAYGLFTDSTYATHFNMGWSTPTHYSVSADGGVLDQYLIAGPRVADVVQDYTWLTGRMPLPPRWSIGFHQSRWEDCSSNDTLPFCSAQTVLALAQKFRDEHISADGLFLDIQHMDGFRSFTWDASKFPDPAAFTTSLAALGFHASAIIDPGLKVDTAWPLYADALAKGFFLRDTSGTPFTGQVWPGDAMFPDFSAARVRDWWSAQVAAGGMTGAWIDMNEPSNFVDHTVPNTLVCDGDGTPTTMAELHNVYAFNEARATFAGLAQNGQRPFVLSRGAFAGQQRYSAVWTGDAPSRWTVLQMTLPMLANLGLSGMTFSGSDVGGYSGIEDASPELFARWMTLGAMSPFFRAHSADTAQQQEPWSFGPEVEDVTREAVGLRYELLPYFYSLFRQASVSGTPILRPLLYDFQDDTAALAVSNEAMIGPSLLFAPIVTEGATTHTVYLPAGRWYDFHSGAIYDGGTVTLQAPDAPLPLAAMPLFVRAGAIIPRTDRLRYASENPASALDLDVYPSTQPSAFVHYEDDGSTLDANAHSEVTFALNPTAAGLSLTASTRSGTWTPPARTLNIRIRRIDHTPSAVRWNGQPIAADYDSNARALTVSVQDVAPFQLEVDADMSISELIPTVSVPVLVHLPSAASGIAIAASANQWTQAPLVAGSAANTAVGSITAAMGDWIFFKITRGDWSSVETHTDCTPIDNRYVLARAAPGIEVTVAAWADSCP